MRYLYLFLTCFLGTVSFGNAPLANAKVSGSGAADTANSVQQKGSSVRVEFFAKPHDLLSASDATIEAGQPLNVGFRITDSKSNYGISDLHPLAWVIRRASGKEKPDQKTCEKNIKKFVRGGVSVQTEADLNNYYILTLNADNSISILNPSINLATSNLLALIPLGSRVGSWVFDEPAGRLYVTLPDDEKLVVVDIHGRTLERQVRVGKIPNRIWYHPDSKYIWVGNDGSGTVSVIDRTSRSLVRTLRLGAGPFEFAFDPENRRMFVSAAQEGRVFVYNTIHLNKIKTLNIKKGDIGLAYSPLSKALYVSYRKKGKLSIVLVENGKTLETVDLKPGIDRGRVAPKGRFVFVLNEKENSIHIVDTASNRVSHVAKTWDQPYKIEFSDIFAYVRYKENYNISLIQLSALEERGTLPIIDVPMGTESPKELAEQADVSPMAVLPEGGGVLVVNPADKVVYYYRESGMRAPSNSFKTYTSPPLGLFIYDHSLTETTTAGTYNTTVRFEDGGVYDVYFLLSTPRVVTCFEMALAGPIREKKVRKVPGVFSSLFKKETFLPNVVSKVRFKLVATDTKKPIVDAEGVRVLSFLQKGGWQARRFAKHIGDGIYEVEFIFPQEGEYHVLVESLKPGIRFEDAPYSVARVSSGQATKASLTGGD